MKSSKILKHKKGVTLIALVITIIVMFILIGVSFYFAVEDGGIVSQSNEAVESYIISQAKDDVRLAWEKAKSEYWTRGASDSTETLRDFLTNKSNLNPYLIDLGEITQDPTYNASEGVYVVNYRPIDEEAVLTFYITERGRITTTLVTGATTCNVQEVTTIGTTVSNSGIGYYINKGTV